MRYRLAVCAFVAIALVTPEPAAAWGFVAHRMIMRRAIDLLPSEIKPFFDRVRDELIIRVVDPDLWRSVGWNDDPNHFLDFGVDEYGPYPFNALPRDYDAAVAKFGVATVTRNGLLPWRQSEEFGNLRRAFEGFKRASPYAASDVVLFSAVSAHYIQDAHQPLHATDNFDGRRSGNDGIHARFERDLVERFESRLRLSPATPTGIVRPRDAAFDALLSGYKLVDPIMRADTEAAAGREFYDDEYFARLFAKVQPILEGRLAEAITATAGLIQGAWEEAGRPHLTTQDARPLQRVRARRP